MEDVVIPYELPETENHSFFFIDQHIDTRLEAKLHRHDAWNCTMWCKGAEQEWPVTLYCLLLKEM